MTQIDDVADKLSEWSEKVDVSRGPAWLSQTLQSLSVTEPK